MLLLVKSEIFMFFFKINEYIFFNVKILLVNNLF